MISGNPIPAQYGLGAAQDGSASPGSGIWLGRAIKVLKGVTCFVSGVAAIATLAAGFYVVAAVCGAVFAVSGLSLLFDNINQAEDASESDSQSPTDDCDKEEVLGHLGTYPLTGKSTYEDISAHYRERMFSRSPSAPVNTTRSERGNESSGNRFRPGLVHLETCKTELRRGQGEVGIVLNQILLNCTTGYRDLTHPRKQLDILKTKEPFDDKLFLELAQLLRVDQPIIDGHQRIDKSEKIALLEREYKQLKEVPEVQQNHALKLMADFQNIKQNLKTYVLPDRSIRVPDPVSDIEIATMKKHVDAFDSLLSRIDISAIAELIQADEELQRRMSKAAEAVQKCKNIFAQTTS